MCDCFHLAFPNWHASATGNGRRLKGPEQDTEDDLICEEPEVLEKERPRPQGSSPVEEFPTTEKYVKQAEGDFYDSPTKSSKKGKRTGFGSLFDKRSSAKMNQTEDMQNDGSEMIVKTVKGGCAEGLVVSGGGKDGLFIKEVKPESPASKHLSVKEGDQLLSATVYFDNVSYEDALQILEHARPYKVEFCLKRKPAATRTQEDAKTMRPEITIGEEAVGEEGTEPEMRVRKKTKKQQDRISWPKFPTFSKGRRAKFKRSHSTSEAEEQRKLEISPVTSDTESPIKSPLKSPDEKDKKKMHKMKLKMRMAGRRSKSVEETQENEEELTADDIEVVENQTIMNIAEEHSFQESVTNLVEIPKMDGADNIESIKTRNECTIPILPVTESMHKFELISLNNTLKTTDITVALGEERKEKSELKVSIQGKDKSEIGTDSQFKSFSSGMRTSDPSTMDNAMGSPNLISGEAVGLQVDSDIKLIIKDEKIQEPEETDMNIPKIDVSHDMSDVELKAKSPGIGSDKEKKERNLLETESYGIRTRGPLADIAISSHFANTLNRLEFASSDTFTFDNITRQDVSSTDTKKPSTPTPVMSQPKPKGLDVDISEKSPGSSAQDIKISNLEIDTSELTQRANIDAILGDLAKKSDSKFKLPKVDLSKFDHQESITIRQKVPTKVPLLKREEIEIPGREDKGSKANVQAPKIKEPKVEKIIKISKAGQALGVAEEFNVDDVKEAVSKFPAFKLPERDITGVLVQREIKIMEMKTGLTPRGSPCKISNMSTEICSKPEDTTDEVKQKPSIVTKDEVIILPKIELHLHDETDTTEYKTEQSKAKLKAQHAKPGKMLARDDKISISPDVKFKLPKREDIEIPGMEAIEQLVQLQKNKVAKETDTQDEAVKDCTDADVTEKSNIKAVRKGHEKKSKKAKVSMPGFGIMKPDIRFPDIGIELPKKATSSKSESDEVIGAETKTIKQTFEKSQESSVPEHETKKVANIEGDQMLHHGVHTAITKSPTHDVTQQMASGNEEVKMTAYEPSLEKAEITSKDTNIDASPHKMKLPKLKMSKIGGKMNKGTPEVSINKDIIMQENDIIEVVLDSEKRTSETDAKGQSFETDKNWSKLKMPSIDVSFPKAKLTKTEGKPKQEETGLTMSEIDASVELNKDQIHIESTGPTKERVEKVDIKVQAKEDAEKETGFRLMKFDISSPKEKTGESGLLPKEAISSEKSICKGVGKTEEPQAEIKDTESKMKKRKISFPKFGFSKSDPKVSDADISLSTAQDSLQEGGADVTKLDVESKITEVEAELKDSTVSPTKFKLPTIKLPKFGISFSKATDGSQMPDVSKEEATMDATFLGGSGELTALPDIKGPEISLSVSKPEVEMSLPEEKAEITGINIPKVDVYCEQKKEIKTSPGMLFSKPEVSLIDHEVDGEVTAFEADQKDLTVSGTPVKFKLPSINLPNFGVKTSRVVKDMPMVDIDAEEPDVRPPEAEISIKLKDDAPLGDIKESHVTTEVHYEDYSVDMKVEYVKPKEQEGKFKLPKFGISLSGVKEPEIDFDKSKTDGDISLVAEKTEAQFSYDEAFDKPEDDPNGSDFKMKRPSFSLPKFGFSKPDVKTSEADLSLQKTDAFKPGGSMDNEESIKGTSAESEQAEKVLKGSPTKFKLPTIKFPKFGVSLPKTTGADLDYQMPGITEDKPAMEIKLPEAELPGELPSLPKMESSNITLSLSKPEVDLSTPEAGKIDNAHYEIKVIPPELAFSKPEVEMSLVDHGLAEETAIADSITGMDVQAKTFDTEVKLPSVTEDADIPEFKEKESETKSKKLKISFPKFGFSKSETKFPDVDTSIQKEGISVPETEVKETEVAIPAPELEVQLKTKSTTGSPSKFKLPTISLPKFDMSISKNVEQSGAKSDDVEKSEIKETPAALSQSSFEISKDMEIQDKEPSKLHFRSLPEDAEIKPEETDPGSHGSRFMMTKFEISFPKLKRPESKKAISRTVDNVEKPEGTLIHDVKIEGQSVDGKADVSVAAKETEVRMKKPKVQSLEHEVFKQDIKASEINVERHDASMTTGEVDVKQLESDIKVQTTTTGGSPIKFKLPTFKLPKFGSSSSKVKPQVTDLSGEAHPLETEIVLTSVEMSDGKVDFTVPDQALIKPFGFDQPKVDTNMSLPEAKPGIPELFEAEVPQEFDTKGPGMKTTKTGFSLPKLGFSKPDIKVPEIDVSFEHLDTSKPEGDMEIKEQSTNITVSKDEDEQKDQTIVSGSTKFKLPSINFPKIGGKATKEEKAIKGHEVSCPDTQIKISNETPSIDIKEPHLVTEGQTVTLDLNVEDTKPEVQGVKLKLPKFGIGLPKEKGFEFSTSKTGVIAEANIEVQKTDIREPEISEGETRTMEHDSAGLDGKMTLPKFGFSKPELKASEIDLNVQKPDVSIPEGSVDIAEANVDIKVSKVEPDQKESTIFGSPTKFKLPSISFPKFGVKSQKAELEIEAANIKIDSSQPEVQLEVHPSKIEIQDDNTKSADIPEVDSKRLEVKVKRPSFSFPKFGFSKPDFTTPEIDASVQKFDASIPESNVHVTDTAEMTLPKVEIEAEQKDLTITGSPTKYKLPTVNIPKTDIRKPEISEGETRTMEHDSAGLDVKMTLPKFGFSKPELKASEIDVNVQTPDVSIPEGSVDIAEANVDIKVSKVEPDQKESTIFGSPTKFKLPSISFPKFGVKSQKAELEIEAANIKIDSSQPEVQLEVHPSKIEIQDDNTKSADIPEVDSKRLEVKVKRPSFSFPKFGFSKPDFTTPEIDANVQRFDASIPESNVHVTDTAEMTLPKVEIEAEQKDLTITGSPTKYKLPTVNIPKTNIREPEISEGETRTIEHDSAGLDVKMTLPKFGFSKPELKASEIDVNVQKPDVSIPEGSVDIAEANVDIKVSKVEPDQKDSKNFGSPTKFKLPSISFPKFGVKSQKAELEIEAANIKIDSSQPEVKLEVHPSKIEIQDDNTKSADIPEVDSKRLEVKVKRPSFSFPKFGFSKPDFTTPEIDASVQKFDASIPESHVHVTDTAEMTLPKVEIEAEQKDLTITGSPTKYKLPTVNISKFGVKTSKGTVSSEISIPEPDIKVSAQIPTIDTEIREKEIKMCATLGETEINLTEGKVTLPDADIQDISIKGKADIPVVDSKGLDVKLKKPSFSLPKLGFSKPDIKGQETDSSQPNIDMSMVEGNIPDKKQETEITYPDELNKPEDPTTVSQIKFKMPSINLPKFGIKYSKATVDIPTADIDIKEPEISFSETGEIQTIDIKTNMEMKGSSANVDIKSKGTDIDGLGKVKLPKMGFSKQELKAPEVDVSLPKADLNTSMGIADVSQQSADIKSPSKEIDLKDDTLIVSPTKFKLPTFNFPKFGIKAPKVTVDSPTANVDIKGPEVSLPDKNIEVSAEVATVDIKGPTVNVEDAAIEMNIKGKDTGKEQQEGKFKLPKFGIALPKIKGQDSETLTEEKISGDVSIDIKEPTSYKGSVEVYKEAKGAELEVEESKFKLPKFGMSLQRLKSPEIDINISKAEGSDIETKEAKPSTTEDVKAEEPADLTDMSSKGLSVKIKRPSFGFPNIGFSKSDGKAQDIQASEAIADMSIPEGSAEIGDSERDIKSPEGDIEITGPQFGSPTKFKLPTIKLPKLEVSTSKVTGNAPKADLDITDVKVGSVDIEVETPKLYPLDDIKVKTAESETTTANIKAKGIDQEGQENKFKLPKFAISLPKVKGLEVGVAAKEVKTVEPEIDITEPEIKTPADDVSLPRVDIALQEGSASIQKTEVETELKDDKAVTGSPSKFKLPTFKMPKFGTSAQKTSDIKAEVAEVDTPNIKTDLNVEDKSIKVSKDIHIEGEIKETTGQATEVAVKKKGEKGSPSKFKLPTIKMPKMSISRTRSQDEDDTTIKASAPDIKTEPKDDLQGPDKSPNFTMPTLGDVFRGFDVEFNVPTVEEMEAQKEKPSRKQDSEPAVKVKESPEHKDKGAQDKSKFKFKFPKLGFSQSSDESDKLVDAKAEESEKHFEAPADQTTEVDKEQEKPEKGGWFKFSKFSSPTKTAKTNEKEIIQPPEEAEKGSINDDVEKESGKANEELEKSPLSEVVEENISPTLSLRSSEAFADISSTLTTEQTGLSQTSPTKVKVKYAEHTATIGVSDTKVQSDVVTSTARCEMISMEPHQPEKVNIPFSSDTSSPSVDTLKQMSGEIHVITTNIQAIPDTQQAAILTNLDAHGIHTSPLQVTLRSDSVLTVEETRVQSSKHTLVEKHVVKETLGDDKETILVTHTTRVFEGESAEPISDETASSIRKLRDTVHTEKMKFFDTVATFEKVKVTSSEISLRHMDSSTDENGEK